MSVNTFLARHVTQSPPVPSLPISQEDAREMRELLESVVFISAAEWNRRREAVLGRTESKFRLLPPSQRVKDISTSRSPELDLIADRRDVVEWLTQEAEARAKASTSHGSAQDWINVATWLATMAAQLGRKAP